MSTTKNNNPPNKDNIPPRIMFELASLTLSKAGNVVLGFDYPEVEKTVLQKIMIAMAISMEDEAKLKELTPDQSTDIICVEALELIRKRINEIIKENKSKIENIYK